MEKITTEPIGNLIIVKIDQAEEKTSTGIYIPETARQKPTSGTVVAVGKGIYAPQTGVLIPMQTEVGDRILYPSGIGSDIEIEGVDYKVMRETDIFGKHTGS